MMHIVLCDDNERHLNDTAALLQQRADAAGQAVKIEAFQNGDALLLAITNREVAAQIAILDIRMQGTNGIDLAKRINSLAPRCQIIFLSGHIAYAMDVYEAEHIYFVLKEKQEERLWPAVELAWSRYGDGLSHTIAFETASGVASRQFSEIMYFERTGRKTCVRSTAGDLTIKDPIGSIALRNLPPQFFKCHQSYIVNLEFVRSFEKSDYVLQSGAVIPVSRAKKNEAEQRFLDCMNAYVLRSNTLMH